MQTHFKIIPFNLVIDGDVQIDAQNSSLSTS